MWWSRRIGRTGVVLLALIAGACGFQPLYGTKDEVPMSQELALVDVAPIKDRIGQELRSRLLDALTPKGAPDKPRYSLSVLLTEKIEQTAVQKTAFATRANMTVSASFTLTEFGTTGNKRQTVLSGTTQVVSSYNILNSTFATLAAENDARSRAIAEIAEDIRVQLAIRLRRQPK